MGLDLGTRPRNSLLAVTVGWLVLVPALVAIARGFSRVKLVQTELSISANPMPSFVFVLATLVFFPVSLAVLQSDLNEIAAALPTGDSQLT